MQTVLAYCPIVSIQSNLELLKGEKLAISNFQFDNSCFAERIETCQALSYSFVKQGNFVNDCAAR
jgi:hypothetical protein